MNRPAASYGVVGALAAGPLRLAAKRAADLGATLHRGMTRKTTHVVFGRLLLKQAQAEIERRIDAARAGSASLLSENALLRRLGAQTGEQASRTLESQALLQQSRLDGRAFEFLRLFDGFEHESEPFSFRDLILARKYAGLLASGAPWSAIARAVHDFGPVGSLTAISLQLSGEKQILASDAYSLFELDGQRRLALEDADRSSEDYWELAEAAETAGLWAEAARLFQQCAEIDTRDAAAPFNQGNCLRELGDSAGAALAYATALKRDPDFVEAWFNLADLHRAAGRLAVARRHLMRAIELDPGYADAIYNLAAIEYDSGHLASAQEWWRLYLGFDGESEWAKRARAGIVLAEQGLRKLAR